MTCSTSYKVRVNFSRIDLRIWLSSSCERVNGEEDILKDSAFRTRYGHFEFTEDLSLRFIDIGVGAAEEAKVVCLVFQVVAVLMQRGTVEKTTTEMLCGTVNHTNGKEEGRRKKCIDSMLLGDNMEKFGSIGPELVLRDNNRVWVGDKVIVGSVCLGRSSAFSSCYAAVCTLVCASEVVSSGFPIVKVRRDQKDVGPKFELGSYGGRHMKLSFTGCRLSHRRLDGQSDTIEIEFEVRELI
ncbi:hypothetical protein Tco_0497007 [Tanacetum coccineum]